MKPTTQPSGSNPDAGAEPAELYAVGRRYAARVAVLRAERPTRRTAVSLTALAFGATPAAVRRAVAFAAAVDALAATV